MDSIIESQKAIGEFYKRNRVEKAIIVLQQDGQEHILEFGCRLSLDEKSKLSKILNPDKPYIPNFCI